MATGVTSALDDFVIRATARHSTFTEG